MNEEYNKTFLQADSLQEAKEALEEVYEANPDAVIIVEEEGKECMIEHGKQLNFVPGDIDLRKLKDDVSAIEDKIPNQVTSENQLADKDFVNSSIASNTAEFKGTYDSLSELQGVSADANDYGFVRTTDSDGNTVYNRYKYVEGQGWVYEYALNNSSFTAAQWAAIQSGITAELVEKWKLIPNASDILTAEKASQTFVQTSELSKYLKLTGGTLTGNLVINDGHYIEFNADNASQNTFDLLSVHSGGEKWSLLKVDGSSSSRTTYLGSWLNLYSYEDYDRDRRSYIDVQFTRFTNQSHPMGLASWYYCSRYISDGFYIDFHYLDGKITDEDCKDYMMNGYGNSATGVKLYTTNKQTYKSYAYLGLYYDGTPYYSYFDDSTRHTLIHEGNVAKYAIKNEGGNVPINLATSGYWCSIKYAPSNYNSWVVGANNAGVFYWYSAATEGHVLDITSDGKVAVGFASDDPKPTEKLHVLGNIRCSGKLIADGGVQNVSFSDLTTPTASIARSNSKKLAITAGKQYFNEVADRIVTDYEGFSASNPEATILSSSPIEFEGDNVLTPVEIPDSEYLLYTIRYVQTSDIKYVLVVTVVALEAPQNGLSGVNIPEDKTPIMEVPTSNDKGE